MKQWRTYRQKQTITVIIEKLAPLDIFGAAPDIPGMWYDMMKYFVEFYNVLYRVSTKISYSANIMLPLVLI